MCRLRLRPSATMARTIESASPPSPRPCTKEASIFSLKRRYCFEVNPQPMFSDFEANTGQPIAHTLARFLCDAA